MKLSRNYALLMLLQQKDTYYKALRFSSKSADVTCWECDKSITIKPSQSYASRHFCPCDRRVILPYTEYPNYFELYNSLPTFNVQNSRLKSTYLKLQYIFHPDRFSISSQREQDIAAEHSAVVSTSYKTLSNTYSRAVYLLLLEGIDLEKNDAISEMTPEFLMEMFEINERLEDGLSKKELLDLKVRTNQQIAQCYSNLTTAFSHRNLTRAKSIVAQLQYYSNILIRIEELLEFNVSL